MMRVVIDGQGKVVKEASGQCGCLATGLVGILNEDVVISDVSEFQEDDGAVWVPACDKHRAGYAKRGMSACDIPGCMDLHTQIVNGAKTCPLHAAKRSAANGVRKTGPTPWQKELPKISPKPTEEPWRSQGLHAQEPIVGDDEPEQQRSVEGAFEVRIRVRNPGADGNGHDYWLLYGEETKEPNKRVGRDSEGRVWISLPAVRMVVSVPEELIPKNETKRARRARVAGLQRSAACVIASRIDVTEADNLIWSELTKEDGSKADPEELVPLASPPDLVSARAACPCLEKFRCF